MSVCWSMHVYVVCILCLYAGYVSVYVLCIYLLCIQCICILSKFVHQSIHPSVNLFVHPSVYVCFVCILCMYTVNVSLYYTVYLCCVCICCMHSMYGMYTIVSICLSFCPFMHMCFVSI